MTRGGRTWSVSRSFQFNAEVARSPGWVLAPRTAAEPSSLFRAPPVLFPGADSNGRGLELVPLLRLDTPRLALVRGLPLSPKELVRALTAAALIPSVEPPTRGLAAERVLRGDAREEYVRIFMVKQRLLLSLILLLALLSSTRYSREPTM